jgi:hypothetical protein
MMGNEGISVADALALRNSGNGNNDGAFGGNGAWWVIILILFFAVGGWGRNGFGNNGGDNGGYNACCVPATAQGMTDAFNFNQLDNGIRSLANGLCDGFYAQNNAINSVASAIQNCCCQTQQSIAELGYQVGQGFCGVDKGIMQSNFQNQAGFNALGNQISSCCCDIERGQDAIKYEMSQLANNILVAGDKNTDRIINYLTQTEMDKLRTELQSAQFQLSQLSQTSNIVNQLMPVAKPAYITCSPYAAAFGFNQNSCGCNSCC